MLEFRAAAFWIDLVRGLSAMTCRTPAIRTRHSEVWMTLKAA